MASRILSEIWSASLSGCPSVTDSDVQHLTWLRSRLPEDVSDLVILTTGTTAYRRKDGVAVIPLALLGP